MIVNHLHKNLTMDRVDRGIFGGASKEFQQSSSAVSNPPSGHQLLLLDPESRRLIPEIVVRNDFQFPPSNWWNLFSSDPHSPLRGQGSGGRGGREVHFRFGFDFATFW